MTSQLQKRNFFIFLTWIGLALLIPNLATSWDLEGRHYQSNDDSQYQHYLIDWNSDPLDPYFNFNPKQTWAWGLKADIYRLQRKNDSLAADGVSARGYWNWKNFFYFHTVLGVNNNSTSQNAASSRGLASVELLTTDHQAYWLELKFKQDYHHPKVLITAGSLDEIFGPGADLRILWAATGNLRFQSKAGWSNLNNKNSRLWTDTQLMWGLQTTPHWLWLGMGIETLQNTHSVNTYWSPQRFLAYGPRVDFAYQWSDLWTLTLGGSYNFIKEESNPEVQGYFVSAGAKYTHPNSNSVKVFLEKASSAQSASTLESLVLGLALQISSY